MINEMFDDLKPRIHEQSELSITTTSVKIKQRRHAIVTPMFCSCIRIIGRINTNHFYI